MDKILLVEDDGALSQGLTYSLEKEGFAIAAAKSAEEGYALFAKGGFSLCILDVGLPDGTGFDLCRKIRKKSAVPLLFLTARDEETDVVMGLDMGGDDYITKPFRLHELVSRVRALLRRASGAKTGETIRSGNFALDTAGCRLVKNGESVALTPAEYRLLLTLMRNPRQTVSRQSLLERLWDSGGDFVDENALAVYIRRLREKIEDDPSRPKQIATVRGIGYRWDADCLFGGNVK